MVFLKNVDHFFAVVHVARWCLQPDSAFMDMQAVVSGSFERIHNLANLMALLNKYRPSLVIAIVDTLMENILTAVHEPLMHAPQACVARTQFLAELYNFAVIKTAHLFSFLYLFVTHGVIILLMCA